MILTIVHLQLDARRRYAQPPEPPPYAPDLDLIAWLEDPDHGPSRPKTWRCWFRCPHRRQP